MKVEHLTNNPIDQALFFPDKLKLYVCWKEFDLSDKKKYEQRTRLDTAKCLKIAFR